MTFRVSTTHFRGRDWHVGVLDGGAKRMTFVTQMAGHIALDRAIQRQDISLEERRILAAEIDASVLSVDGSTDPAIGVGTGLESLVAEEKISSHLM